MIVRKSEKNSLQPVRKRADFVRMNRQARKWAAQGVILQVLAHGEPAAAPARRVGFTVTKKTEPSAVRRNRIKRRLRAAAQDVLAPHARPGYDYVLIGRPQSAQRPYDALCGDLKYCLKKLDVWVAAPEAGGGHD